MAYRIPAQCADRPNCSSRRMQIEVNIYLWNNKDMRKETFGDLLNFMIFHTQLLQTFDHCCFLVFFLSVINCSFGSITIHQAFSSLREGRASQYGHFCSPFLKSPQWPAIVGTARPPINASVSYLCLLSVGPVDNEATVYICHQLQKS